MPIPIHYLLQVSNHSSVPSLAPNSHFPAVGPQGDLQVLLEVFLLVDHRLPLLSVGDVISSKYTTSVLNMRG